MVNIPNDQGSSAALAAARQHCAFSTHGYLGVAILPTPVAALVQTRCSFFMWEITSRQGSGFFVHAPLVAIRG